MFGKALQLAAMFALPFRPGWMSQQHYPRRGEAAPAFKSYSHLVNYSLLAHFPVFPLFPTPLPFVVWTCRATIWKCQSLRLDCQFLGRDLKQQEGIGFTS